jgi:low affinity Fe/Cu permease
MQDQRPNSKPRRRPQISRLLHSVGDLTSNAWFVAAVAAGVVGFLIALAIAEFSESWQVGFATCATAITLVMVFVIQHTQRREQLATQLKLDELIRSSPHADDLLVHVETAPDEELLERERCQIDHHTSLRGD